MAAAMAPAKRTMLSVDRVLDEASRSVPARTKTMHHSCSVTAMHHSCSVIAKEAITELQCGSHQCK